MENFKENFYKILINRENFYMKQYHSNLYDEEVFFAIKELREGIYCVLITTEERKKSDYYEALSYIKTLEKKFSLNMIILTNKENYYEEAKVIPNELIINEKEYKVLLCDNSCIPLREIFEYVAKENIVEENINEKNFLKYKIMTMIIILINIIVFIVTKIIFNNMSGEEINSILMGYPIDLSAAEKANIVWNSVLIGFGAKYNILIEHGQIWRLVTCAFLHSGFIHIACNMYSLYIIGPQINQIYGTGKYLVVYIISCITSSLLSFYMSPNSISVGASGGIFGLMGALLAFAVIERHRIEKRYLSSLLQIIIINLFIGLNIRNIDNFGHIGGLLGGISIGYVIYKISQNKREA